MGCCSSSASPERPPEPPPEEPPEEGKPWPKSKWPKSSDPEPWPESDIGSFYSVADNSVSLVGDNADTLDPSRRTEGPAEASPNGERRRAADDGVTLVGPRQEIHSSRDTAGVIQAP